MQNEQIFLGTLALEIINNDLAFAMVGQQSEKDFIIHVFAKSGHERVLYLNRPEIQSYKEPLVIAHAQAEKIIQEFKNKA